MTENRFLEAALFYANKMKWYVVPLHSVKESKCSCMRIECAAQGKHPRIKDWVNEATIDVEKITRWWGMWPDSNVGIATGKKSGVVVLDNDPRNGGEESLFALEGKFGKMPETIQCLTGGGGTHDYYKYEDMPLKSDSNVFGPGIDVRTDGGMVVVPPSHHKSGKDYAWESSHHPEDFEIKLFPKWLLESIKKLSPKAKNGAESVFDKIGGGSRNKTLASIAGTMRRRGLEEESIAAALLIENEMKCNPPLEQVEVQSIAHSVARYAPATNPKTINEAFPECRFSQEVIIPDGWNINQRGIFKEIKLKGGTEWKPISRSPVFPIEKHIDLDSGVQKVTLSYYDNGKWETLNVLRETLSNQNKIVSLSNYGLPIHSVNAGALVLWFSDMEFANKIPVKFTSSKCGWKNLNGKDNFVFGQKPEGDFFKLEFEADGVSQSQVKRSISGKGDLDEWIELVTALQDFPKALIAIYHSLTAPLLSILEAPNFIVDYSGPSTIGKSTALRLAASVWGIPNDQGGMINSWNSTRVYIERFAACINDLPVILDESHMAKDDVASSVLYMLANGIGRGRGSKEGIQKTLSWKTVVFSSGERPIETSTMFEGAKVRTVSYWESPFGKKDQEAFVRSTNRIILENYGLAGPAFIQELIENKAIWPKLKETYNQKIIEYQRFITGENKGVKGRMVLNFAATYIAARIADKLFDLGDDVSRTIEVCLQEALAALDGSSYAFRAYAWVKSWIMSNSPKFQNDVKEGFNEESKLTSQWFGKWINGREKIGIFPGPLKKACKEEGFDYSVVVKVFRDNELIECEPDRVQGQFKFNNQKVRGIILKWNDD